MPQVMQLHELPPVSDGYLRVIRGERIDKPKASVQYIPATWIGLPCPEQDGIKGVYTHMNCAAYLHTLNEWWPEGERAVAREYGMHFIVLDVPEQHCRKGEKQAVILRDAAVPVALIH